MKIRSTCLYSLFACLLLPAAAAAAEADALGSAIDAIVAPYVDLHLFGGVVLVARGDRVLATRPYGMANVEFGVPNRTDTRFPIASITKRFMLLVLHRLADEGKLSFDDPLARWAPGFPSADKITVDHLVNHRSGIRDPDELRQKIRTNWTTAAVVDLLAKTPLASLPGETRVYTTANYAVLAYIVERVTGQSFAEVMERYVYGPAGMRDSGELTTPTVVPRLASGYMPDPLGAGLAVCGPEDTSWKAGGGSSYATAGDLHRFFRALYAGKLSSKPARELFATSQLGEHALFSSSGSFPGANASALYFPADELTVVVLSNNYAPLPGTIAETVAKAVFGMPYEVAAAPKILATGTFDPRMLGSWNLEGLPYQFTLELRSGTPILTWTPARQSAYLRIGERTWFSPFDWARIEWEPDYAKATWTAPWAEKPLAVTRATE